jgi:signal transduction histidine kinase
VIIMIATAAAGSAFFLQSRNVMSEKIREELRMAAELGAMQIHGDDLAQIHGAEDQQSAVYLKVVQQLRDIRSSVPGARFAYIFRRTGHPKTLAFVADADATSSDGELDRNHNGRVDNDEIAGVPGELYDTSDQPELQGPAFLQPITSDVYIDQWGALLSGFAPIYDSRGKSVAVIGIDMDADEFINLSQSAFSPISLLLVLTLGAVGSVVIGYVGWSRREKFYRRLDEERSALVGLAMHQIGAPLSSMRWWIDLLKENDKEHAANENADAFKELDTAITRMSDLIESLRKATSISEGTVKKTLQKIDLYEIITDAIAAKELASQKKNQRISLDMEQQINVEVDHDLIEGVVLELLDNAISFSPENTQIEVTAQRKGRTVTVSVRDHGYGVPAADMMNMFREFKRASNATKYKPVGNGLGLFVSRRIIELSGGRMWLESEEGKGTTVWFTLPVA